MAEDEGADAGESELNAAPIVAALAKHGVKYVIVGSYGAIVQMVPLPMTDIDIVPSVTEDNLVRVASALAELEVRDKLGSESIREELLANPAMLTEARF